MLTARDALPNGQLRLVAKWYRIISAGEEAPGQMWVGLSGPDWISSSPPVQAAFADNVIGVFTETMNIPSQ
jgi:hypothetical protein